MNMDYADAVNQLEDEVATATSRVTGPLTNKEIATELRRIADQIENEKD